ncbi:uncharacterized protein JCM6883_001646 [Sporobolomyces salmoneus]|uniref:uncharacterized protein n=1 Tax=Sporobolomyces salmoneus TaxID=183962 RepID=UPI00317F7D4A
MPTSTAHERSPLLPNTTTPRIVHTPPLVNSTSSSSSSISSLTARPSPVPLSSTTPLNTAAGLILTEDDIAIEGMVLALLKELQERGYTLPPGLPTLPPDMPLDEAEAECTFLRKVLTVERHRKVLDKFLPNLLLNSPGGGGGGQPTSGTTTMISGHSLSFHSGSILATNATATSSRTSSSSLNNSSSSAPARPSPLSSQTLDTTVITSPSALFLSSLLSLLISLQAEPRGIVQETDRGVDGELRMFKARRELGERLYAVVEGLLDSYLVSGDEQREEEEEEEDALVTLLFHDFPLNYDSMDRATCAIDLLLNLSSFPFVEAEDLVSHPVVLACTEYVWRNGLLPPPKKGQSLTWTESFVRLDRFSIPRILHSQSYILSTLHAAITVYILIFSAYSHFDSFNALAPDAPRTLPIQHGRPEKTWSIFTGLVWWLWVAGTLGWAGEVGRAWLHRGPVPSLPLSPSTLLPLLHHALVFVSLFLRAVAFWIATPRRRPSFMLATSLSLLAWSVPFLAASRVLPQNSPAFGAPTHQQWQKIRDGRKTRDVGYRPPPKKVPVSHRALRSLEANLGGLIQFATYFAVFGALTLWSLSGEIDYPGVLLQMLHFPLVFLSSSDETFTTKGKSTSPIEARTSLAFTLVLGVVLAFFAGGRPSISPKPIYPLHPLTPRRELDDLDGWDRYGREVAFRSRRERLAITRYFSFVPPVPYNSNLHATKPRVGQRRLESLASAFSTPPLPSPLNLFVPWIELSSLVVKRLGGNDRAARRVQEVGRLWVWRIGISPLGGWALGAKGVRQWRGRE